MIDNEKRILSAENKILKHAVFEIIEILDGVLEDPSVLNVYNRHI